MKATNKYTGEVIEYSPSDLAELMRNYREVSETIKAYEEIKKKLSKLAEQYLDDSGTSEVIDGYQWKQTAVQRMNYDKAVMRQVLDEDVLDLLLEPSKTSIDHYLAEHLEELGDISTQLRQSMIAMGNPYTVTRLEKLTR